MNLQPLLTVVFLLIGVVIVALIYFYFHNAGIHAKLDALLHREVIEPGLVPPPPIPVSVQPPNAGIPTPMGVVGRNGLTVRWSDYAGQLDTQVFPAVIARIGRALTSDEVSDAYTSGVLQDKARAAVVEAQQHYGDHTGFDLGTLPDSAGMYRRNLMEGGKRYLFKFVITRQVKMRLIVAPETTMGKGAFDNIDIAIRREGQKFAALTWKANIGASYIPFASPFQPGAYEMDVTIDKTELVALQFGNVV